MRSIADRTRTPGRADAAALLRFTDALVEQTEDFTDARRAVIDVLGIEAVAPAVGAAANFEMMNRIVDAVGVHVPVTMKLMGPQIGLAASRKHS